MKISLFSINFLFNGESYNLQTSRLFTLKNLIQYFNYKQSVIVIEYNGKILNPKKWSLVTLKNEDKIEILTIVGGG